MELYILMLTWLALFAHYGGTLQASNTLRLKRDTAGELHIVNNHAPAIHAEVKRDATTGLEATDKPCPKNKNIPSHIEGGVVFQVTPPEDSAFYQEKSLRKSLIQPNKLDLIRNIGRVITLAVLLVSAVLEFYPLLFDVYNMIYSFLYL